MHQVSTTFCAWVTVFALGAVLVPEASAQGSESKLAAANAVIGFRVNWMGDATPFNSCSVFQAAERPADFPEGISPPLRRVLDRSESPCENRAPQIPGRWTPEVAVDSVVVSGDTATVFATVRKGEMSYFEEYSVVRGQPGQWSTREVRIWGALREYPIRPSTE
jgi:hypothetical protein